MKASLDNGVAIPLLESSQVPWFSRRSLACCLLASARRRALARARFGTGPELAVLLRYEALFPSLAARRRTVETDAIAVFAGVDGIAFGFAG